MSTVADKTSLTTKLFLAASNPSLLARPVATRAARLAEASPRAGWLLFGLAALLEPNRAMKALHRAGAKAVFGRHKEAASLFIQAIRLDPARSEMYAAGVMLARKGSLHDEFFKLLVSSIETKEL